VGRVASKRPGKVLRQRYADAGLAVQKSAEPEGYGQDSCNISSSSRNHFAALPWEQVYALNFLKQNMIAARCSIMLKDGNDKSMAQTDSGRPKFEHTNFLQCRTKKAKWSHYLTRMVMEL